MLRPPAEPRGHEVVLRGVTFGYGHAIEPVIGDLDVVIPEGNHLAVVGPSGAGKSTLGARALVDRLGGPGAELDPRALSAGERQLLTLVRSYVSEARLMILDEATCHLDPAAEARVERAFADRAGSLLVIAHRISSALRAPRVLVLDDGGALVGSHAELLVRSSLYRDLLGHWGEHPPRPAAMTAPVNGAPTRRPVG